MPPVEAPTTNNGPKIEVPKEKEKMTLRKKLLIGGAGVALVSSIVGIGIGVNANGQKAPEAPATSEPVNPAEPAPVETPIAPPEEQPSGENIFKGTVNYAAFENFGDKDADARDAACAEFYDANLESDIKLSKDSTGSEIAQWHADHVNLLFELNNDTSDPRNHEAALSIAECLTSVQSESADGREELVSRLNSTSPDGSAVTALYINPDKVTRYSELFNAKTDLGTVYNAKSVEGLSNNAFETVYQTVFEWNGSKIFPAYQITASDSGFEDLPTGGLAPVVVDPAYENKPWH